jgi:hypothetical protein
MNTRQRRQLLYILVMEILVEEGCTNSGKRMRAKDVFEVLKTRKWDAWAKLEISDANFSSMLSSAIRDQLNPEIVRPEGGQGYFVNSIPEESRQEIKELDEKEGLAKGEERNKERLLYPFFVKWLRENGYNAKDTSEGRAGGRWGNPDVTGVRIMQEYGLTEIEVATIEVKLNDYRWQYDIFEAVAHRRFGDYSYFAFAVDKEEVSKYTRNTKSSQMSYYCSTFEVGVLVVAMPKEFFSALQRGQIDGKGIEQAMTDPETYEVIEVYPSRHNPIALDRKRDFLDAIGLPHDETMHQWGQPPIEG